MSGASTLLSILILAGLCADEASTLFLPGIIHRQAAGGNLRVGHEGGGQSPTVLQQFLKKRVEPIRLWAQPTMLPLRLGQLKDWAAGIRSDLSAHSSKLAPPTVASSHVKQPKGGRKSSGDVEGCCDDRTKGAVLKDGDGNASVAELKWSDVTPWKLIVADSFATVVEKSLLFPIDTLRTRMQVDETPGIALAKQLVDVTCSTWKEGWNVGLRRGRALVRGGGVVRPFGAIGVALEGVRGGLQRFYSGLSFSVVNQIPSNVIYLVAYQKAKELVEVNLPWLGKTEEGSPWPPLIASVVTEFACTPFDVPHDIVTQKFQTVHVDSLAPFQRTWKTPVRGLCEFQRMLASEGLKGVYSSTTAHLLTYLPWSTTWWCSYELSKVGLAKLGKPLNITGAAVHMGAGSLAGLAAAAISNPIDILKTRMQCDARLRGQGILTVARDIVRHEGPQALCKGLAMAVLFDCIVSAGGGYRYNFVMSVSAKRKARSSGGVIAGDAEGGGGIVKGGDAGRRQPAKKKFAEDGGSAEGQKHDVGPKLLPCFAVY